jgi:hypothetical protein
MEAGRPRPAISPDEGVGGSSGWAVVSTTMLRIDAPSVRVFHEIQVYEQV